MTDVPGETTETTEATEAAPEATPKTTSHGRPRPLETVKRDETVLTLMSDGKVRSRREVAEAIGVTEQNLAYLSLDRLRADGKVKRVITDDSRFGWVLVTD